MHTALLFPAEQRGSSYRASRFFRLSSMPLYTPDNFLRRLRTGSSATRTDRFQAGPRFPVLSGVAPPRPRVGAWPLEARSTMPIRLSSIVTRDATDDLTLEQESPIRHTPGGNDR